jgi:hypothetical protein
MPAPRLVRCALLLACAALVLSVPARSEEPLTTEADVASPAGSGLDMSFHLGWHAYREPALAMRLDGPVVGLRLGARPGLLRGGLIEFAGEVGTVDYRSDSSGTREGARRIRTDGFVFIGPLRPGWQPQPGIGFGTEWTDLRGFTTGGAKGYERFNLSLWFAAQWWLEPLSLPERPATLRAGVLLSGWQASYLSQVSSSYGDVINRQRRGLSLALDAPWQFEGWRGSLGLRVQRYADSGIDYSPGLGPVYEPANRSFDLRLSVQY